MFSKTLAALLTAVMFLLLGLTAPAVAADPPTFSEECPCWKQAADIKAAAAARRASWRRAKRDACGNNKLDAKFREQCDPAMDPVDCEADCRCAAGSYPDGAGQCTTRCGDGRLGLSEQCDGGPYCDACQCPEGTVPNWGTHGCSAVCGDGILAPGEACDSSDDDAHCVVSTCQCSTGFEPDGKGKCSPRCGNGTLEPGELCDAGLADSFCIPGCQSCREGFEPHPDGSGKCRSMCGNGTWDRRNNETCDHGIDTSGNCSLQCLCKSGYQEDPDNAGSCREVPKVYGGWIVQVGIHARFTALFVGTRDDRVPVGIVGGLHLDVYSPQDIYLTVRGAGGGFNFPQGEAFEPAWDGGFSPEIGGGGVIGNLFRLAGLGGADIVNGGAVGRLALEGAFLFTERRSLFLAIRVDAVVGHREGSTATFGLNGGGLGLVFGGSFSALWDRPD